MKSVTILANDENEAMEYCLAECGFYPAAIREVGDGAGGVYWLCFESAEDADIWDKQI